MSEAFRVSSKKQAELLQFSDIQKRWAVPNTARHSLPYRKHEGKFRTFPQLRNDFDITTLTCHNFTG